jgi:biotin operon repressor
MKSYKEVLKMRRPTDRKQYSIELVWSPRVAKSHFIQLPKLLLLHQADLGITSSELNVLLDILYYKWTSAHPYASYKTLGSMSGMSAHTVRTNITQLKDKGLLIKVSRGANQSRAYDITPLIERLESYPQISTKMNPQGAQIQAPTYTKMDISAYSNTNTELYDFSNTHLTRRTVGSGKVESMDDIIARTHGVR